MRREADTDAFSFARTFLSLERDEFALETRIGNAQNELSCFFLNPSRKKEKGARSLEISKRARSVSQRTRRRARGKNSRNLSRTFTCTRSSVLFIRASSFFFRACVRFVCARLVLTTFFFPVSKSQDIFRFSFCFLGENTQKGDCRTKKKARSDERKRFLFLFFGGKDLFVVLPKSTQT